MVRIHRLYSGHVEVLADIVEYIAKREGISVKEANGRLLVDLRLYFNRGKLRSDVLELEERMKVLRNFILYDFDKRFGGMTTALELLGTIKQIVAKDYYNWDANLLSRDLKDLRRWREMRKKEQERQHMTTTASTQPAPLSSPSTPQSQEEAIQSSPSQSDAKPSAADAEPTTHENEEHEEESQEGGQTDAEGNKDASLEPQHPA